MPVFTIQGKVKPYVRMTQRGKWVKKDAREYLDSKAKIARQIKAQMTEQGIETLPPKTPLVVTIDLQSSNGMHTSDLDNSIKAVLDAAQGPLFRNDCWIDSISANRWRGEKDETILKVEVLAS